MSPDCTTLSISDTTRPSGSDLVTSSAQESTGDHVVATTAVWTRWKEDVSSSAQCHMLGHWWVYRAEDGSLTAYKHSVPGLCSARGPILHFYCLLPGTVLFLRGWISTKTAQKVTCIDRFGPDVGLENKLNNYL